MVDVTVIDYVQRGEKNTRWLVKDKEGAKLTVLVANGREIKEGAVLSVESKALIPADEALLKRLANRKIKVGVDSSGAGN